MIGPGDFRSLWRSGEQDEFRSDSPKVAELGRSIKSLNKYNAGDKLDYREIEGYKKNFAAAFGRERMQEAFGAIDAKMGNGRSVKNRDIKSAFDQAYVYQQPGRATKKLVQELPPRIEEAQKRVRQLERRRGEIELSTGPRSERERKLGVVDQELGRARSGLSGLQQQLRSLQTLDDALEHPPKPGEDEEELTKTIGTLRTQIDDAARALRALRAWEIRLLSGTHEDAGMLSRGGLVSDDGGESGAIGSSSRLDDGREEIGTMTVAHLQQRAAEKEQEIGQLKGALTDAKQRLDALRATPEVLRARQEIAALGQDPRLYGILRAAVPEKVAVSAKQERGASWRLGASVPWAAEKAIGIAAGPALLPLNAWRALSAEKLERHMVGAAKGLDSHPFARGVAAALARSAGLDAARAGFSFAIGSAFAAPSLLPTGGTAGAVIGTVASNAMRHGGTATHQAVSSVVGDTVDTFVGEGIDRTVGRQFDHAAEADEGGPPMPTLPVVTPDGSTVHVDLNDTEVLKAFLAYLWPPQDAHALGSSKEEERVAESRRVDFRTQYFGAKPMERFAHRGSESEDAFAARVKAIHAELTGGRPGKAMAAASPLLVLYVALQWTD